MPGSDYSHPSPTSLQFLASCLDLSSTSFTLDPPEFPSFVNPIRTFPLDLGPHYPSSSNLSSPSHLHWFQTLLLRASLKEPLFRLQIWAGNLSLVQDLVHPPITLLTLPRGNRPGLQRSIKELRLGAGRYHLPLVKTSRWVMCSIRQIGYWLDRFVEDLIRLLYCYNGYQKFGVICLMNSPRWSPFLEVGLHFAFNVLNSFLGFYLTTGTLSLHRYYLSDGALSLTRSVNIWVLAQFGFVCQDFRFTSGLRMSLSELVMLWGLSWTMKNHILSQGIWQWLASWCTWTREKD